MQSYNFEMHLTIECKDDATFERFKKDAEKVGAKVIAINLAGTQQVMTSKTIKGTVHDCFTALFDDHHWFAECDYKVIRTKVESCPKFVHNENYEASYYEIHVPCYFDKIKDYDLNTLSKSWHRSSNKFKDDVMMITCRVKCDKEFKTDIEQIDINKDIEFLKEQGIVHTSFKHHYEYAICDTNDELDKGWII